MVKSLPPHGSLESPHRLCPHCAIRVQDSHYNIPPDQPAGEIGTQVRFRAIGLTIPTPIRLRGRDAGEGGLKQMQLEAE